MYHKYNIGQRVTSIDKKRCYGIIEDIKANDNGDEVLYVRWHNYNTLVAYSVASEYVIPFHGDRVA